MPTGLMKTAFPLCLKRMPIRFRIVQILLSLEEQQPSGMISLINSYGAHVR